MSSDCGLLYVGASVFEAPVEGGELWWVIDRGLVEDLDTPFSGGRPILRVRERAAELSCRWCIILISIYGSRCAMKWEPSAQ